MGSYWAGNVTKLSPIFVSVTKFWFKNHVLNKTKLKLQLFRFQNRIQMTRSKFPEIYPGRKTYLSDDMIRTEFQIMSKNTLSKLQISFE